MLILLGGFYYYPSMELCLFKEIVYMPCLVCIDLKIISYMPCFVYMSCFVYIQAWSASLDPLLCLFSPPPA